MAEVAQRLSSGAYRLSALRNSRGGPVCKAESPGPLLVNCSVSDSRGKDESTQGHREVQPVTKRKATHRRPAKLSRVRTRQNQQENGTLELHSPRFICCVQTRESVQAYKTALYLSAELQPLLQEKLIPGRMTSWTRVPVSIHPDAFRCPQQLRAFCTVICIRAEGSERLGRLKLHPDTLQVCSRSYSWRSGSSSRDVPPLYRSKTAYYDILKVSPSATQSQIKTAYYKQSFIYHPDKNPGNKEATELFSEVSEAYTVLGNISLRRKYDRGILSQSDLQSAGRPSSKESQSRSAGSPHHRHHQQQQQHRARHVSKAGGKIMFDFDAFYQAHYGEQLRRERDMRARREHLQQQQKETNKKREQGKLAEMTLVMVLATLGLFFINLSRS